LEVLAFYPKSRRSIQTDLKANGTPIGSSYSYSHLFRCSNVGSRSIQSKTAHCQTIRELGCPYQNSM
jgi:hypothetical protein